MTHLKKPSCDCENSVSSCQESWATRMKTNKNPLRDSFCHSHLQLISTEKLIFTFTFTIDIQWEALFYIYVYNQYPERSEKASQLTLECWFRQFDSLAACYQMKLNPTVNIQKLLKSDDIEPRRWILKDHWIQTACARSKQKLPFKRIFLPFFEKTNRAESQEEEKEEEKEVQFSLRK